MVKNGKRRIVIEIDEQKYEILKTLKENLHAKSWADLLLRCLDNSATIIEIERLHNDVKDLSMIVDEILRTIRER
ncbi:MAG: ATPase [Vulcanisaeta sp. AZ3]|jgi:hypothetical protein|nr:MAG: ATPase [Vulcanisaeta sp. AZ3]